MSSHRHGIGQIVRLKDRTGLSPKAAYIYRIEALLPVKDGVGRYRLRNEETGQERVVSESNLYVIERISDPDAAFSD